LSNPLEQFELDPASSKVNGEALLIPRERDEERQPFPHPPTQFFPMQEICSHVKMLTRCCRLYCCSCTCSSPCLRARTCPEHQHGGFPFYLNKQLLLTVFHGYKPQRRRGVKAVVGSTDISHSRIASSRASSRC